MSGTAPLLRPYQQISLNNHLSQQQQQQQQQQHQSSALKNGSAGGNEISRIEISRIYSGSHNHNHNQQQQQPQHSTSAAKIITTNTRQYSMSSQDLEHSVTTGGGQHHHHPPPHPYPTHYHHHHHPAATPLKLPPVVAAVAPSSSNNVSGGGLLIGGSANNMNCVGLTDALAVKKKTTGSDLIARLCFYCKKKTGLASSYMCRCGNNYCTQHRNAEAHMCTYDYKTEGRKLIEQSNPLVAASKLPKI